MEQICDPRPSPKMKKSKLRTHSETLVRGQSTYKLTYTSKLAISVGRNHASKLGRVNRWLPEFSSSEGFILQKFNDARTDQSSQPWRPTAMGVPSSSAGAPSQLIALSCNMAAALFSRDYVAPIERFLEEEMKQLVAAETTLEDGEVDELYAHKEAIKIPPPAYSARTRNPMGTLIVGTTFSNFNVVRRMFSDEDAQFEDEDGRPQLLSQIVMTDSKAKENSPPLVRFSAPASDMLAILKHEPFREMVACLFRQDSDSQYSIASYRSAASEGDAPAKRRLETSEEDGAAKRRLASVAEGDSDRGEDVPPSRRAVAPSEEEESD